MYIKKILSIVTLSIALLGPNNSYAKVYSVTVKGKDAPTAEKNAQLGAVRKAINEIFTPQALKDHSGDILNVVLRPYENFITSSIITNSNQLEKMVEVRAEVDVDVLALQAVIMQYPTLSSVAKLEKSNTKPLSSQELQALQAQTEQSVGASETRQMGEASQIKEIPKRTLRFEPKAGALSDEDFIALINNKETSPKQVIDALKKGANPNAKYYNDIALSRYIQVVNDKKATLDTAVVKAFIDEGVNLDWNSSEHTIIHKILRSKNTEALKLVMAHKNTYEYTTSDNRYSDLYALIDYYKSNKEQDVFLAELIKQMLEYGANPNFKDNNENPVLFLFAQVEMPKSLGTMLAHGADVNAKGANMDTVLIKGIANRKLNVVDALVGKTNVDLNVYNNDGVSALLLATKYADRSLIEKLLNAKTDPNVFSDRDYPPIVYAAEKGKEFLDIFIHAGADIKAIGKDKYNVLMAMCTNSKYTEGDLEKILLKGFDINAVNSQSRYSALNYAAGEQNKTALHFLLHNKANPNNITKDGKTALFQVKKTADFIYPLLDAGADVTIRARDGSGILHSAADFNDTDVLQACIDKGADPNIVINKTGVTPLIDAIEHNPPEDIIQILLNAGVDVKAVTKNNLGVLHYIRHIRTEEQLQAMLAKGAPVNIARKDNGETPLIVAIWNGVKPEYVKLLLDAGADPNAKNKQGKSALQYLQERSDNDLTKAYKALFGKG